MSKEKFLSKYLKVPVLEYKNQTSKNPLVSVCVQTYQQVAYISKCLDGILMQKTDFDFEILLGEDDSSDGTREICIEYAKKNPTKIKLFLHSRENNIEIDGRPSGEFNVKYGIFNALGKYITICEGDDFWTDPLKLQKQVYFLEENVDYNLVFSDISMIDQQGNDLNRNFHDKLKTLYKSGHIFWELLENNFINTLTICVRRENLLGYFENFLFKGTTYDYRIWLHIATYGKIKYLDENTASYRVHVAGISRIENAFVKRTPLVKQSAMLHFLDKINYNPKHINETILTEVVYSLLKNKNLKIKEKAPTILLLRKQPKYILYLLQLIVKKIFDKI
jgi:glycosyltransferase involved in cell wall biosynthesis